MRYLLIFIAFSSLLNLLNSCSSEKAKGEKLQNSFVSPPNAFINSTKENNKSISLDFEKYKEIQQYWLKIKDLPDSAFVNVTKLDSNFILDIKYATTDNFVQTKMYECGECWLRKTAALALVEAQKSLIEKGYRIKLFDCYRPHSVQWQLWNKVPNPQYVANPEKGSMHNRGAAIDLGITDLAGNELDMGSPYDSFSKASHHSYQDLPTEILERRKLLKETMAKHQLKFTTSEWWHYSYQVEFYPISDFRWECGEKDLVQ
jgi:D-alanyl-D-alanine dipeptidase